MLSLALLTISLFAAADQAEMDKALAGLQAAKSAADAAAPLNYVLAHAQEAPSPHLFIAAAAAMSSNRLSDAGYLFYAAQLRGRYDVARFPPKGKGGDSPTVLLGAFSQQIGGVVNPAVMRDPKAFAEVVTRVSKWTPVTSGGYSPTWEYTSNEAAAGKKVFDTQHAQFVKQFGGLSTLLNDPQYFAAFKVLQDYNMSPQKPTPAQEKAKSAAIDTMMSIEKQKGIEGLFYKK
jgi:hypothetical protein